MLKNAIWLFSLTIVVLILFLPSYTKMQDLKQINLQYEQQIKDLVYEQARLKEELRMLKEDPDYLEKVAREKMGLVRDGEVVYKIMPVVEDKKGNE